MANVKDRFLDRAREGLNALQDRVTEFSRQGGIDAVVGRVADRIRAQEERLSSGKHVLNPEYMVQLRQWYARLELKPGAPADEVRQSFRRLMRKYHPDRFTGDAESEALATRLSQELTVAYEGLMQHLDS